MRKSGGLEFMWDRPMTLGILVLALALLVYPIMKDRKKVISE
jgi:putative tricarboxylic transport membrane protein